MSSALIAVLSSLLLLFGPLVALACERPAWGDRRLQADGTSRGDARLGRGDAGRWIEQLRRERRTTPGKRQGRPRLGGSRLSFVPNAGQIDERVAFYTPTFAGTLFVTQRGELVYTLRDGTPDPGGREASRRRERSAPARGLRLTETFVRGEPAPVGQEPTGTTVSDFRGGSPGRSRSGLPTYDQVGLGEVWPGVSVALRARDGSVEKIFTVRPGASAEHIRMAVTGADALTVSDAGALVAHTALGEVTFSAPVAFQERAGTRHPVSVAYARREGEYGFTVGTHDPTLPLVIDPLLQSSYVGGECDDVINGVAIHPTTNDVYVAGFTSIPVFPGAGGGIFFGPGGSNDVFVARMNAALTKFLSVAFIGGSDDDFALTLAIHPATGAVYVAGLTFSSDFPNTATGAQPTLTPSGVCGCDVDAFVALLSASLTTLTRATYLGGADFEQATALGFHPSNGQVYVAGSTFSTDFPGVGGIGQSAQITNAGFEDAFVSRLSGDLTTLVRSTYLGGTDDDAAYALVVHATSGGVYVGGFTASPDFTGAPLTGPQPTFGGGVGIFDGFVAWLRADLSALLRGTFLGGADEDAVSSLAIHPSTGDVYAAGSTFSTDFPGTSPLSTIPGTANGAQTDNAGDQDGFIVRLNAALTSLIQATYLGGSDVDQAKAVAIHPFTGEVYVAGVTASLDFPGTTGGVQPVLGGLVDLFIARLPSTLTSLLQSTYLGGTGVEGLDQFADILELILGLGTLGLAISPTGHVYIASITDFADLNTYPGTAGGAQATYNGGDADGVVSRLTFSLALVDPTVPTMSEWLQLCAAALLLATGLAVLRRRRSAP